MWSWYMIVFPKNKKKKRVLISRLQLLLLFFRFAAVCGSKQQVQV